MSRPDLNREELVAAVSGQLGMELSTVTVLLHAIIAERLGLGPTDHKVFGLLERQGPLTAGALARMTGLTTGAITGVVDRLERAGHVERTNDLHDRRKVVIAVRSSAAREAVFGDVFAPLGAAMAELCTHYSDAELATIHAFMSSGIDILRQQTMRLTTGPTQEEPEQQR